MNKRALICERLKFGYASERRMRLYEEDLQFVSNAIADCNNYSVLDLGIKLGNLRHLRIPPPVVSMLERELERGGGAQLAA